MMICEALMRHLAGKDRNLKRIAKTPELYTKYKQVLRLISDNDISQKGAFSI